MKKILLSCFTILSLLSFSKETDILGYWINSLNKSEDRMIAQFFKLDTGIYIAKIYKLTQPYDSSGKLQTDKKNPNPELRNRLLVGMTFMNGLKYNEQNKDYEFGFIYDPMNGKTYHCNLNLKDNNTLILRGSLDYYGLFGKNVTWYRYTINKNKAGN